MSSYDWSRKRVLVTGGSGFLGSHLVEALRRRGCEPVTPRSRDCDLRDWGQAEALLQEVRPHVLFHLAAVVGGIGANRRHPGKFFFDNAMMGIQIVELARRAGVEKQVLVGTVCAYPKFTPVPFREEDLWSGYPEETNAPYGLAKKMLLVQAQAYRQEYGTNAIFILPTNLYGPRDNFHPDSSHVVPAMIQKFDDARQSGLESVLLWGDGSPSRDFLYVADAADGLVMAAELYDEGEPVNLGSGREVTIRDLAEMVARHVGYRGRIEWDTSQPNGQPRRCLETSRAAAAFGFAPLTDMEDGLRETVSWYRSHLDDLKFALQAR